jgi:tRNA-splicing ligase RtcB (3'-phosphate/5'-hydroxy nucleic acid ligase)
MAKKQEVRTIKVNGTTIKAWSPTIERDKEVQKSLRKLKHYPDIYSHVALMPDYHLGETSINGSIIPSKETLYLNAIGGDIGCGIASINLGIREENLEAKTRDLYKAIVSRVPTGRRVHIHPEERIDSLDIFRADNPIFTNSVIKKAKQQMGTVGDGNHFVEIQKDQEGNLYAMVHTGSRYLGQVIREVHSRNGSQPNPKSPIMLNINDQEGEAYLQDSQLALAYSEENRKEILRKVLEAISETLGEIPKGQQEKILEGILDVPHNFIAKETHFGTELLVHRKGAIYVPEGSLGIIAGTMGTPSYIVQGRGNKESFESASHGAGRRMPRGRALRSISHKEFLRTMDGIESRKDENVLDESPQAYKSIKEVMRSQKSLVRKVEELFPLINVRG